MLNGQVMLDRANENSAMLNDYVFLTRETTGPARKLHDLFDGPYIVKSVPSPNTAVLHDPENKRKFPRPLHHDRLKVAYVRQPTPSNYFNIVTHAPEVMFTSTGTQTIFPDMHVYAQDTEIDSVGHSELSSCDDKSNAEMHEDMCLSQSQTPTPVKSNEIQTQS